MLFLLSDFTIDYIFSCHRRLSSQRVFTNFKLYLDGFLLLFLSGILFLCCCCSNANTTDLEEFFYSADVFYFTFLIQIWCKHCHDLLLSRFPWAPSILFRRSQDFPLWFKTQKQPSICSNHRVFLILMNKRQLYLNMSKYAYTLLVVKSLRVEIKNIADRSKSFVLKAKQYIQDKNCSKHLIHRS